MDDVLVAPTLLTAIGCGLNAGVFFGFCSFVMKALAGGALYLVGAIGLTVAYHVPRNNALATVEPHSGEGPRRWSEYAAEWTLWNHVRTAAALAAQGALTIALVAG